MTEKDLLQLIIDSLPRTPETYRFWDKLWHRYYTNVPSDGVNVCSKVFWEPNPLDIPKYQSSASKPGDEKYADQAEFSEERRRKHEKG